MQQRNSFSLIRVSRVLRLCLLVVILGGLLEREAAAQAGSFAPKIDFGTGSEPISVAVGDFNGDGMVDLAEANSHIGGQHRAATNRAVDELGLDMFRRPSRRCAKIAEAPASHLLLEANCCEKIVLLACERPCYEGSFIKERPLDCQA